MKRFGKYNDEYSSLFETYAAVNPGLYREAYVPTITEENNFPLWSMVHTLFLKEVQGVKDE